MKISERVERPRHPRRLPAPPRTAHPFDRTGVQARAARPHRRIARPAPTAVVNVISTLCGKESLSALWCPRPASSRGEAQFVTVFLQFPANFRSSWKTVRAKPDRASLRMDARRVGIRRHGSTVYGRQQWLVEYEKMKAVASIIGILALGAAGAASADPGKSRLADVLFSGSSSSQLDRQSGSQSRPDFSRSDRGWHYGNGNGNGNAHGGHDHGNGHTPGHGGGHCRGHHDDFCGPASP